MAKITDVSVDYDETLPFFGATIIIHLVDKQAIFLSLEPKANDLPFSSLREGNKLFDVKTDGNSIYWTNGARLTFDEIMEMLKNSGNKA